MPHFTGWGRLFVGSRVSQSAGRVGHLGKSTKSPGAGSVRVQSPPQGSALSGDPGDPNGVTPRMQDLSDDPVDRVLETSSRIVPPDPRAHVHEMDAAPTRVNVDVVDQVMAFIGEMRVQGLEDPRRQLVERHLPRLGNRIVRRQSRMTRKGAPTLGPPDPSGWCRDVGEGETRLGRACTP